VLSARLYGSRGHQTKRLLGELTEGKKDEETAGTDYKIDEDVPDEAVRDLLASMQETQLKAMSLYAKYLMERDK
jgi:hypothetical protein